MPLCKIDGSDIVSRIVLDLLKRSWICFQNKDWRAETTCHTPSPGNPMTRRDCAETVRAAATHGRTTTASLPKRSETSWMPCKRGMGRRLTRKGVHGRVGADSRWLGQVGRVDEKLPTAAVRVNKPHCIFSFWY
jgi:hypothetical protein